jgi:hypothetical protein
MSETPSSGADANDPPEALNRMLAIWNEPDAEKIRGHIEAALSEEVLFIDPDNHVVGHAAFEAMVKTFRERLPEAVCSRSSAVDAHHGLHRYHWEIHQGEQRLIEGFDVAEIDASGKVCRIEGFFGAIPRR